MIGGRAQASVSEFESLMNLHRHHGTLLMGEIHLVNGELAHVPVLTGFKQCLVQF